MELITAREECLRSLTELDSLEEESAHDDEEMQCMVEDERKEFSSQLEQLEEELLRVITPSDEADTRNAVLEVRSGTGGDEASLFASEIFRMYERILQSEGSG